MYLYIQLARERGVGANERERDGGVEREGCRESGEDGGGGVGGEVGEIHIKKVMVERYAW